MQQHFWVPPAVFRLLTAAILHLHPVDRAEVIPPVPPQVRETAVLPQRSIARDACRLSIEVGESE